MDMQNGRVVKGVHFVDIKDAGDPIECARVYCKNGEDELALLVQDRRPNLLVASCSVGSPKGVVEPYEDELLSVAQKHSLDLVLAGAGPWSHRSRANRVASFAQFHDALGKRGKAKSSKQGKPNRRVK